MSLFERHNGYLLNILTHLPIPLPTATVKMAETHPYFACGFIAQSSVTSDPRFLVLTPGVSLVASADSHGQQYTSPETAVGEKGADVVIVGRGITQAEDPGKTAKEYAKRAFEAYLQRLK